MTTGRNQPPTPFSLSMWVGVLHEVPLSISARPDLRPYGPPLSMFGDANRRSVLRSAERVPVPQTQCLWWSGCLREEVARRPMDGRQNWHGRGQSNSVLLGGDRSAERGVRLRGSGHIPASLRGTTAMRVEGVHPARPGESAYICALAAERSLRTERVRVCWAVRKSQAADARRTGTHGSHGRVLAGSLPRTGSRPLLLMRIGPDDGNPIRRARVSEVAAARSAPVASNHHPAQRDDHPVRLAQDPSVQRPQQLLARTGQGPGSRLAHCW